MKCLNCKRNVPNKDFLTKKGCKWCDKEYHEKN